MMVMEWRRSYRRPWARGREDRGQTDRRELLPASPLPEATLNSPPDGLQDGSAVRIAKATPAAPPAPAAPTAAPAPAAPSAPSPSRRP